MDTKETDDYFDFEKFKEFDRLCKIEEIFDRPIILTRQTADEITAAFDIEHYYYSNTIHGTTKINYYNKSEYVLGLLNSKLDTWYYRQMIAKESKTFSQVKIEFLRLLPIYKLSVGQQQPIIELVKQILAVKKENPATDIVSQESEIDILVYDLYGLTEEEINILEGKWA